jgi:hypothetical protein
MSPGSAVCCTTAGLCSSVTRATSETQQHLLLFGSNGSQWQLALWCTPVTTELHSPVRSHPGRSSSPQWRCHHVTGPCYGQPRGTLPPRCTWHSLQACSSSSSSLAAVNRRSYWCPVQQPQDVCRQLQLLSVANPLLEGCLLST